MSETLEPDTGEMIVKRVSVPIGLEELMEGLTKEVLLKKPDDIYVFAADYFSRLLLLRDKGSYKVKPSRNVRSAVKQTPKPPVEKLLVRGASKQLSRQVSVRGESPTKRIVPPKKTLARNDTDKDTERNQFIERRRIKRNEKIGIKSTNVQTKEISPRSALEIAEKFSKTDRSLSSTRRERSTSKGTPRQKIPVYRKADTLDERVKSDRTISRNHIKGASEKDDKSVPPFYIKSPDAIKSEEIYKNSVLPRVVAHVSSVPDTVSVVDGYKTIKEHDSSQSEEKEPSQSKMCENEHDSLESTEKLVDNIEDMVNSDSTVQNSSLGKEINGSRTGNDDITAIVYDKNKLSGDSVISNEDSLDKLSNADVTTDIGDISETKTVKQIKGATLDENSSSDPTSKVEEIPENENVLTPDNRKKSVKQIKKATLDENSSSDSTSKVEEMPEEENVLTTENRKKSVDNLDENKIPLVTERDQLNIISNITEIQTEVKENIQKEKAINQEKENKLSANSAISNEDSLDKLSNADVITDIGDISERKTDKQIEGAALDENSSSDPTNKVEEISENENVLTPDNRKKSVDNNLDENKIPLTRESDQLHIISNNINEISTEVQENTLNEKAMNQEEQNNLVFNQSDAKNTARIIVRNISSITENEQTNKKENSTNQKDKDTADIIEKTEVKPSIINAAGQVTSKVEPLDEVNNISKSSEDNHTEPKNEPSEKTSEKENSENYGHIKHNNITLNSEEKAGKESMLNVLSDRSVDDLSAKYINNTVLSDKEKLSTADKHTKLDIVENEKVSENIDHTKKEDKISSIISDSNTHNAKEKAEIENSDKNNLDLTNNFPEVVTSDDIKDFKQDKLNDSPLTQYNEQNCSHFNDKAIENREYPKNEVDEIKDTDKTNDALVNEQVLDNNEEENNSSDTKQMFEKNTEYRKSSEKQQSNIENKESPIQISESDIRDAIQTNYSEVGYVRPQTNTGADNTEIDKSLINETHKKGDVDTQNSEINTSISSQHKSNSVQDVGENIDSNNKKISTSENNLAQEYKDLSSLETNNSLKDEPITQASEQNKVEIMKNITHIEENATTTQSPQHLKNSNTNDSELCENYKQKIDNTNNIMQSIIHIAEGGLVDHKVKTYITDFIKNENQHVFAKVSNGFNESSNEIDLNEHTNKNTEYKGNTEAVGRKDEKYTQEYLDNKEKNGKLESDQSSLKVAELDEKESTKEKYQEDLLEHAQISIVTALPTENIGHTMKEHISSDTNDSEQCEKYKQKTDNTNNIIQSVIHIAEGSLVDHKVKTYITDFIKNENQHVFAKVSNSFDESSNQIELNEHKNKNTEYKGSTEVVGTTDEKYTQEYLDNKENNGELESDQNSLKVAELDEKECTKERCQDDLLEPILNSTVTALTTENIDHTMKEHITDFLHNEKNNTFKHENMPVAQKHIAIEPNSQGVNETPVQQSILENNSSLNTCCSTSDYTLADTKDECDMSEQVSDKKLRRIKTADDIRRDHRKSEISSRIPTADYRTRVVREESGKHFFHIKRSTSHADNLEEKILLSNNVQTKKIQNEPQKLVSIIGTDQASDNIEQKGEDILDVEKQIVQKVSALTSSSDQNILGKHFESLPKDLSNRYIMNDIMAAIRIQSMWRGYKVRKNKGNILKHQSVEMPTQVKEYNVDENSRKVEKEQITKSPSHETKEVHITVSEPSQQNVLQKNVEDLPKDLTGGYIFNEIMAAIRIQSMWRGFKVRNNKNNILTHQSTGEHIHVREPNTDIPIAENKQVEINMTNTEIKNNCENSEKKLANAATIIQKNWRSFKDRKNTRKINKGKEKSESESDSAKTGEAKILQPVTSSSNIDVLDEKFEKASRIIQKHWRGFKARKNVKQNDELNKSSAQNMDSNSNYSLSVECKVKTEHAYECGANNKNQESDERSTAALKIQKNWRRFKLRQQNDYGKSKEIESKDVKVTKQVKCEDTSVEPSQLLGKDKLIKAATLIQKIWRGFNVRKLSKLNKETKNIKATEKSTMYNGISNHDKEEVINKKILSEHLSTHKSPEMQPLKSEDKFVKAALLIQKVWRGFNARNLLNRQTNHFAKEKSCKSPQTIETYSNDKFIKAAINIQRIWRGFHVRNITKRKSEQISNADKNGQKSGLNRVKRQITESLNEEEKFARCAILIQKVWRGFKVRKNLSKNNISVVTSDKSDLTLKKQQVEEKFVKAAVIVQKIWRGFKVRKTMQETNIFGKKIKNDKAIMETIKDDDLKNKNSALKIQSLWRGYQARKNINVIKNKLEDTITVDDKVEGRELTDADILNAATKIQAGVRGYLQRKKYNVVSKLNSISEEDDEKHTKLTTEEVSEKDVENTKKLSEDEVLGVLEDLDKLKVPDHTPLLHESNKLEVYSSNALETQEPAPESIPQLLTSISLDKDNNNNNSEKCNKSTPLELKETTEAVTKKCRENLSEVPDTNTKLSFNDDKRFGYKEEQSKDLSSTKNESEILTNSNFIGPTNGKSEIRESKAESKPNLSNSKDDSISEKESNLRLQSSDDNERITQGSNSTEEKVCYERPLSIDSNDSAVTVIHKELPENTSEEAFKSDIEEPFSEHETLINDFQNKLLDQISGKNDGSEYVKNFDIEQLRKELNEAGLISSNGDRTHMRHENSKEILEDHDELLGYFDDFKNENGKEVIPNSHLVSRDLPDIKEEELENKNGINSEPPNIHKDINHLNSVKLDNEDISGKDFNLDKIKSTLKECEEIAREINMGFEAINSSNNQNCAEEKNHDEGLFCGTTEKQTGVNIIPNDVEIMQTNSNQSDSAVNKNDEHVDQRGQLESESISKGTSNEEVATNSSLANGLLHTGEFHDSVIVPSSGESDSHLQNEHCIENANRSHSSQNPEKISEPKLLHTGELHDTVVIPLPREEKDNLKIEEQEHSDIGSSQGKEIRLTSPVSNSNNNVKELKVTNGLNMTGLLHTGELHDALVMTLPKEVGQFSKDHDKLVKPAEAGSTKKHLESEVSSKKLVEPTTQLLHTGELHDSVVVLLPKAEQGDGAKDTQDHKTDTDEPTTNPRHVDNGSQTNGATSIAVQLNEVPAGVEALTSPRPLSVVRDVDVVQSISAHARDKGALSDASSPDRLSPQADLQSMESEKRNNNETGNNKSMEAEAATKIQAGFRGYQVRKQLKLKNGSSDINNQRRQLRRKSSGRLTEAGRTTQNKPKDANDIEEQSAVKIQAGVRGFLVRRRQKKQKNQES